jgi:hypothetical protein
MSALSWSATRARTLQNCRRRYYYRYHLAPRAREPAPPREAVEAARLQHLVGVEAWAGDVVHAALRFILSRWRTGREVSEEETEAHAARLLSRGYRDSQAWWAAGPEEFPSRPALLDLHYYPGDGLDRQRAARIRETVLGSVRAFLRSGLAEEIRRAGPSRWLPIDRNAAARLAPAGGEPELLLAVRSSRGGIRQIEPCSNACGRDDQPT